MLDRFNWFSFDPSLFMEAPDTRWAKGDLLANAWSGWASQSRRYRNAFEQGDEAAIFNFARHSSGALVAPWVLTVLRRWQSSGGRGDKQKIRKFFNAWVDSRGKRPSQRLFAMIRRDKEIECRVLDAILADKTKEVAIEEASEALQVTESMVEEIHREYWQRGRRLFRHHPGPDRVETKFRDYLRTATPETIWDQTMSAIDDESTAFFLDAELKSLSREGRIRLEDFHPIEWSTGRFFDRLFGDLQDGERLEIKVLRKMVTDQDTVVDGDYIRLDLSATPNRPVFWEWDANRHAFYEVRVANAAWRRDLDRHIR